MGGCITRVKRTDIIVKSKQKPVEIFENINKFKDKGNLNNKNITEIINPIKAANANFITNNSNTLKITNESKIQSLNPRKDIKLSSFFSTLQNKVIQSKIEKPIFTDTEIQSIKQTLANHFLFKGKPSNIFNILINSLEKVEVPEGAVLFKKMDKAEHFFIIKEGTLKVETDYGVKVLLPSDTFGEMALLQNDKRTATVSAMKSCVLYLLNGKTFREIINKNTSADMNERIILLKGSPILNVLENSKIHSLANGMVKCEFKKDDTIIYEGDEGQSIYLIKSGAVVCYKNKKKVRVLGARDFFGENAVLFGTNRSMTIVVIEKLTCYQISKSFLIETLGNDYRKIIITSISKNAIKNSKYLKTFLNDEFFRIMFEKECREIKSYSNKEVVIHANEKLKCFYILLSGNMVDSKRLTSVATKGQLFGDALIRHSHTLANDIISEDGLKVIEFNFDLIIKKLNLKVEKSNVFNLFNKIENLKKTNLLKNASDQVILELAYIMKKEQFQKGKEIVHEKEVGNKLYLIRSGKVRVYYNEKFKRELGEGACFGEVALINNSLRSATIVASVDCVMYTLDKQDFNKLVDDNMRKYLGNKMALEDSADTMLENLFFVRGLGHGKFGSVSLVHNNKTFFAIKAVNRKAAEKQKMLIKYYKQERNILLQLDHPFVMKLVKTLKNDHNIFYLLEYIPGRTFSKYLQSRTSRMLHNSTETMIYIANLLVILDYLNSKGVCHRDLKPDNLIVDENGLLKIVDFGNSIILKDFTSTITGTPHYIAPEILTGKGYGFSCDYWSLGIIAYEIYFGTYPFGKAAHSPVEVYKDILSNDLHIHCEENKIVQLIQAFLKKKVSERVCTLEKAKSLDLFYNFSWYDLLEMRVVPSYVPKKVELKDFSEYYKSYAEFMEEETKRVAQENDKNSIVEDEDDDYDENWADCF